MTAKESAMAGNWRLFPCPLPLPLDAEGKAEVPRFSSSTCLAGCAGCLDVCGGVPCCSCSKCLCSVAPGMVWCWPAIDANACGDVPSSRSSSADSDGVPPCSCPGDAACCALLATGGVLGTGAVISSSDDAGGGDSDRQISCHSQLENCWSKSGSWRLCIVRDFAVAFATPDSPVEPCCDEAPPHSRPGGTACCACCSGVSSQIRCKRTALSLYIYIFIKYIKTTDVSSKSAFSVEPPRPITSATPQDGDSNNPSK